MVSEVEFVQIFKNKIIIACAFLSLFFSDSLFLLSLFLLSPNPLIVESRELTSTIQLAPGILLTPFGALQEVRKHIMWAELIAAHSNSIKLNSDICTGIYLNAHIHICYI